MQNGSSVTSVALHSVRQHIQQYQLMCFPLLLFFSHGCCDLNPKQKKPKKNHWNRNWNRNWRRRGCVGFGKHQHQIHSPCEAFEMWQMWQVETSGEMLPITLQEMKYGLSGTIREGHDWPDVCAWRIVFFTSNFWTCMRWNVECMFSACQA